MNKNDFDVLLDHACFDSDIVEVKKMLKRGANVNYADDNPLYNAIADDNVTVVKLLIEYNIDIHFSIKNNKNLINFLLIKLIYTFLRKSNQFLLKNF
jgi:ankyrin repeat protein